MKNDLAHARSYLGLLTACLLLLGGCANREHIRDDFGARTRTFLGAQHVYSVAAEDVPRGLDSEEASIIHGNYRESLGGAKAGPTKQSSDRVLLLRDPPKEKD